jgi:stage II sporulation protein M
MSIIEDSAAITSGLSSIGWFGFYIFKNGLVGLLCVLTGRITWGAYPFLVIMVNSVLLGCMALLLNDVQGVSALSFFAGIAPHGIVEIFAICLSCALGMRPGKMREKLVMFAKPFGLLLIAAAIETFISPLIIARVL